MKSFSEFYEEIIKPEREPWEPPIHSQLVRRIKTWIWCLKWEQSCGAEPFNLWNLILTADRLCQNELNWILGHLVGFRVIGIRYLSGYTPTMCVCVYIYMHIYVYPNIHVRVHTHIYSSIKVHVHTHPYPSIYVSVCTHTYPSIYIYMCTYTYPSIHVHVHTYTHTVVFISTRKSWNWTYD